MSRLRSQNSALMSLALGLGSALWIAAACGEIEAEKRWPEGAALLADTRSLDRLLEQFAQLEGTPLARQAERLRTSLPSCQTVEGHAETGELLWQHSTGDYVVAAPVVHAGIVYVATGGDPDLDPGERSGKLGPAS